MLTQMIFTVKLKTLKSIRDEVLKDKSEQNENPIDLLIPTNDVKYTYKQARIMAKNY